MSPANQTMLARFAVATSIFALLMVAVVAVRGNDSSATDSAGASAPVAVALSEFAISPSDVTVPLGGSLAVTNNGTVEHNVTITDTSVKTANLAAGATETLDVSSLEPGQYEIFCSIPGHKDSGMTGTLTVTDGSAASAASHDSTASASGASHGTVDIGALESTDPIAKKLDQSMRDGMDAGVATFLDNATKYAEGKIESGNQILKPTILPDGTKQFNLTAAITDWEVSPGKVVKAWTTF